MGKFRTVGNAQFSLALSLGLSAMLWAGAVASGQPAAEDVLVFSKPLAGIYLQKGQSSERIVLRQGPSLAPRLAPSGRKLLLNSFQGGKRGIWIGTEAGEHMQRICDGDQGEWSPEGDKIVLRRDGTIIERRLDTGAEEVVTPAGWADCRYPSYCRGGGILFVRGSGRGSRVFLFDPKKSSVPQEILEAEIGSAPRCSPDGRLLAYPDGAHIHLLNLEDGRKSQLTTAGGVQSWPMWSLDGRSVGYCQEPGSSGPCDVHAVRVPAAGAEAELAGAEAGKPAGVRVLCQGVDLAPDWRGNGAASAASAPLKGTHFSVWVKESDEPPLSLARMPSSKDGWKPLGEVRERVAVQKAILAENDWISMVIAPEQVSLAMFSKSQGGDAKPVAVALAVENASASGQGACSLSVLASDKEGLLCEVSRAAMSGKVAKALCRISRATPCVQWTPQSEGCEFLIANGARFILIPDRFSNDMLIEAGKSSAPEIFVPSSPFVLAPAADGGSAIMVITPSPRQSLALARNAGLFSIKAVAAGESMFVSLLPPKSIFCDLRAETDSKAGATRIAWSPPFPAQWRASLFGRRNYSAMIEEAAPSGGSGLPIKGFAEPVGAAMAYLYGRSGGTPLDVLTPEDILRDALGMQSSERALDAEGITGSRTTPDRLDLRELLLPSSSDYQAGQVQSAPQPGDPEQPDVLPWRRFLKRQLDFSPVLELLGGGGGGIGMADTEGVKSAVDYLSGEVLNLLTGLDERMGEYEGFLSDLRIRCDALRKEDARAGEFLDGINREMDNLASRRKELAVADLAKVREGIEGVKALIGSGGDLGEKKEFERFCEASLSALSERQAALQEYRDFARTIRDNAGLAIIERPEAKDAAQQVRELTQKVLRNRCYLEDDWRGEIPRKGDGR